MGPIGSGALAKPAINLPHVVFWQALGEAFALARPLEKDPEWMVQLFTETAGGANVLKVKAPAVAAALEGNPDVAATFDIDAMRKDLRMMRSEAAAVGVALPVANIKHEIELVRPDQINEAMSRVKDKSVRYRFVIDLRAGRV